MALPVILRDDRRRRRRGEERLCGYGRTVVIRPGMEMRGGLTVMDGFEHFGSDEGACASEASMTNASNSK